MRTPGMLQVNEHCGLPGVHRLSIRSALASVVRGTDVRLSFRCFCRREIGPFPEGTNEGTAPLMCTILSSLSPCVSLP